MNLKITLIPLSIGVLSSSYALATTSQFLFVSNQDGDREIYTSDVEGKNIHQLTNNSSDDYLARWSPDGDQIVFTSNRENGNSEVFIMNSDGSNPVNISKHNGYDGNAIWSPDGQKLVFCSDRTGAINLFSVNKNGKEIRQLTHSTVGVANPVWSPSGEWIAYYDYNESQKSNVVLVSSDGSKSKPITNSPKIEGQSIDWSPDSTKLAYESRRGSKYNIYSYDLTLDKETQLTDLPTLDTSPKWSNNGKEIVFLSSRKGKKTQLHIMNSDGSNPRSLTELETQDGDPALRDPLIISPKHNHV